jgi:hypothetical protein
MTEAYDGRQVVGMDLHRRRSVLVRMIMDGRKLETVRIQNSPAALRAVIARDSPAPASIPHTVRRPAWARNPQARPQNVRKEGAVNSEPNEASSIISEAGRCGVASGSIGGNPFHRRGGPGCRGRQDYGCWRVEPRLPDIQAARRRTSQMVAAMRISESASSQPLSIHWKGQNRLAGW